MGDYLPLQPLPWPLPGNHHTIYQAIQHALSGLYDSYTSKAFFSSRCGTGVSLYEASPDFLHPYRNRCTLCCVLTAPLPDFLHATRYCNCLLSFFPYIAGTEYIMNKWVCEETYKAITLGYQEYSIEDFIIQRWLFHTSVFSYFLLCSMYHIWNW